MQRRVHNRGSGLALAALGLSLIAAAAVGVVGLGGQRGWWTAEQAVGSLPAIAVLSVAAGLVGVFARFFRRDGQLIAVAAILICLALIGGIGQYLWRINHAPLLVDISTDLSDPPAFETLAVRSDRIAHVPVLHRPGYERFGPDERWRAVHADSYPQLRTLALPRRPAEVVMRAARIARERGWPVAVADPVKGRLEVTVPSRFFGFRDDLVLRARAQGAVTAVDLRGVARTGRTDHGRIALLIARLQRDLAGD
jgi:hypothetical protein